MHVHDANEQKKVCNAHLICIDCRIRNERKLNSITHCIDYRITWNSIAYKWSMLNTCIWDAEHTKIHINHICKVQNLKYECCFPHPRKQIIVVHCNWTSKV